MILIQKSWNKKQARHPEVDIESATVATALYFLCCYKHLKGRRSYKVTGLANTVLQVLVYKPSKLPHTPCNFLLGGYWVDIKDIQMYKNLVQ